MKMIKLRVILVFLLLIPSLAWTNPAAETSSAKKISRWESNLSLGVVLQERIGILKSVWWYPLPKIFAVGLSFDYIGSTLPLMLNISLNLPLRFVVPFVCAGAGTSISRGGIADIGGGLKFRIWPKIGIIIEYRKYSREGISPFAPKDTPRDRPDYIGAGISYVY